MSAHRDLFTGVLLIVASIILFAITFTFDSVPAAFAQGMQADVMPRLLLALIVLLSGAMIIGGWKDKEPERQAIPMPVWATMALLALAGALIQSLGVSIIVFLAALILPVLWGEKLRPFLLAYALSGPIAIYLIFTVALQLRLPQGPLASLLN